MYLTSKLNQGYEDKQRYLPLVLFGLSVNLSLKILVVIVILQLLTSTNKTCSPKLGKFKLENVETTHMRNWEGVTLYLCAG
jgi:hypothetical protein